MKVVFFFRKPAPQFNSIEELFETISQRLSNNMAIEKICMPYQRISLKKIVGNIKYARKNSGKLNLITGHINYIALGLRGKTILTIHDIGSSLQGNLIHSFFVRIFWYWIPALMVKKITVISEFSKNELVKLIPFAKHKIKVIYNPVNERLKYTPKVFNSENPTILVVGTKANKNIENTIKALNGIPCELHIIGKLTTEQISILAQSGIKYHNQFFISYEEIVKAYQSCDFLCFASTYEGFGMPIIEAQAIGRPVLTSNFGAMKEVAGKGACLVDPYSITSIKSGIEKLIENDAYRTNLIQQGLKNVERFKLDIITNEYLNLYKELDS